MSNKLFKALELCREYHYILKLSEITFREFCDSMDLSEDRARRYVQYLRKAKVIAKVQFGTLIFVKDFDGRTNGKENATLPTAGQGRDECKHPQVGMDSRSP